MSVDKKKVLVTGLSGLIGGIVGRDLATTYDVTGLARQPVEGFSTTMASITDFDSIKPAFDSVHTVVHMAGYMGSDDREQIAVNVTGTFNVFEAARQAGVKRVVFASSGAVQEAMESIEPFRAMTEGRLDAIPQPRPLVTHLDPIAPKRVYGAVKAFGEALGRCWAEQHGMSVICIRFGRVTPEDRPANVREASVYLSHRDAAQIVRLSVEAADSLRFATIYGVSDNFTRFRDIANAREILGYVPRDGIRTWPLDSPKKHRLPKWLQFRSGSD